MSSKAIEAALAAFNDATLTEGTGSFHTHKCSTCASIWFHSDLGGLHHCPRCHTPNLVKHHMNLTFSVAQSLSTHKDAY